MPAMLLSSSLLLNAKAKGHVVQFFLARVKREMETKRRGMRIQWETWLVRKERLLWGHESKDSGRNEGLAKFTATADRKPV